MALEVGLAATEWDLLSKTAKCASPWRCGAICLISMLGYTTVLE